MVILNALPFLWQGLLVTLQVSAIVVAIALVFGVLFGTALTYAPRWVAWPVRAYSDIARGLPLITLIFFVYYAMPALKVNVSGWWAAVAALAAFETAHVAEVTRGALQSIHPGQTEAGRAIGLTFAQRMVYVIFPQALRRFLPPWINTVVDTVKGSALVSLVGIVDLMLAVQQVIGRCGSGKTTMLRCVNLLETYDSGSITVDGVEVGYIGEGQARRRRGERELARVRADIGMVFQLFNLFPHLTARENVMLGLRKVRRLSKGEAGDIADRWLARVGLGGKRESLPYELSGGQQQRVGIARAVAMNPKVLL